MTVVTGSLRVDLRLQASGRVRSVSLSLILAVRVSLRLMRVIRRRVPRVAVRLVRLIRGELRVAVLTGLSLRRQRFLDRRVAELLIQLNLELSQPDRARLVLRLLQAGDLPRVGVPTDRGLRVHDPTSSGQVVVAGVRVISDLVVKRPVLVGSVIDLLVLVVRVALSLVIIIMLVVMVAVLTMMIMAVRRVAVLHRSVRVSVRRWRDLKALDPVIERDVGVLLSLDFPVRALQADLAGLQLTVQDLRYPACLTHQTPP